MAYEDEEDRKEREEDEFDRLFGGIGKELGVADLCRRLEEETTKFSGLATSNFGKPLLDALHELKTKIQRAHEDGEDLKSLKETALEVHRKLSGLRENLERYRDTLVAKNDSYTATREFLAAHGLKSTAELDPAGKKELLEHLEELLKKIVNS